jgi:hypothetical protein
MITVALSDAMLSENTCQVLSDALLNFFDKLYPTDFLCVNIGDNRRVMTNDAQDSLLDWQNIVRGLKNISKYVNNKASANNLLGLLEEDQFIDMENDLDDSSKGCTP